MPDVYMIGNAHLDPVWLWRWQDGFSEILATYRSALDRLYEFPETKFTSACAVYYQWIEKIDSAMFSEIQEMVKAGRWEIVGGWFLQPDCNIPDGESFMRHTLFSQRYFQEKFGITAKTGYNVDSFGHNAGLPKILKAGGMENYVFMRPSKEEQENNETLFQWESDDGSSVRAFRIPIRYNLNSQRMDQIEQLADCVLQTGCDLMGFYGVGNHGGGPTIRLIDSINKLNRKEIKYATTAEYFDKVKEQSIPVIKGELQHHARGCYSAETSIKRGNRKCEQNLLAAERFCLMAQELTGATYPSKKLNKAWKNLMFTQFHDILGGCSIRSAYEDAHFLLGETMSITEQEINTALQRITWNIDTLQGETLPAYKYDKHDKGQWAVWEHEVLGTPVVVFNPHPWQVTQCVQVYAHASKMTDAAGNEIPCQIVRGEHVDSQDKWNTAFLAEVPAMGYAVYRLFIEKQSTQSLPNTLTVTQTSLENSRLFVEFDRQTGDICRMIDKESGKVLIDKACRAVILDETACDTWAHNQKSLGEVVDTFSSADFEITETGPVRASVRITVKCRDSVIQRTYTLAADANSLQVHAMIDFHEKHKTLKFTFPLTEETVVAKIPYGTIRRNGYTGEEPCGSWIASGDLAIANDCKYAYDTCGRELRMTVLRSAIYADHFALRDEFCQHMEQGIHEFDYCLFYHGKNSESEKKAAELNFGLRRVLGSFHKGVLPEEKSCIEVNGSDAIVSAVKKQEDGEGTVLRLYEINGEDCTAQVKLFDRDITVELTHNSLITINDSGERLNAMEWRIEKTFDM